MCIGLLVIHRNNSLFPKQLEVGKQFKTYFEVIIGENPCEVQNLRSKDCRLIHASPEAIIRGCYE